MICECMNWARTDGGTSNHHPNCKHYKLESFAEIEHDGATCIVELRELPGIIADAESEYIVRCKQMTREEFNRIPDFSGF